MKGIPSQGLVDVVQIRPRKNEELLGHVLEKMAGAKNVSVQEMVVPSVAQMSSTSAPYCIWKLTEADPGHSMIEPECRNDIVNSLHCSVAEGPYVYR